MDEATVGAGPEPAAEALASAERLMGHLDGYFALVLLGLAHRSGVLASLLDHGGTAADVAAAAGTHQRSTEELLAGLTAAGYLQHEGGRFAFAEGQDAVFRPGLLPFDVTVFFEAQQKMGEVLPLVADSLSTGAGVPYAAYQPEFSVLQDRLNGPLYEQHLVEDFLGSVDGLVDALESGAHLADIGCGGGQALCLLGARFPRSSFTGIDIDAGALEIARRRAEEAGLANVRFEQRDAGDLGMETAFDAVLAVDAIHDQGRPEVVLAQAARALRRDGVLVMVEPLASGDLDTDVRSPMATMAYTTSLTHCVQVSLASGGPGLGSMWGRARAVPMLRSAGFSQVEAHESPADYLVYAARR